MPSTTQFLLAAAAAAANAPLAAGAPAKPTAEASCIDGDCSSTMIHETHKPTPVNVAPAETTLATVTRRQELPNGAPYLYEGGGIMRERDVSVTMPTISPGEVAPFGGGYFPRKRQDEPGAELDVYNGGGILRKRQDEPGAELDVYNGGGFLRERQEPPSGVLDFYGGGGLPRKRGFRYAGLPLTSTLPAPPTGSSDGGEYDITARQAQPTVEPILDTGGFPADDGVEKRQSGDDTLSNELSWM